MVQQTRFETSLSKVLSCVNPFIAKMWILIHLIDCTYFSLHFALDNSDKLFYVLIHQKTDQNGT